MRKIFLAIFLLGLCLPSATFAYVPETTHAGLTEQLIEFYNLNNPQKKISTQDKEDIIQGSIDEDGKGTVDKMRPLNHFYDPVRNMGIEGYRKTIDWALGGDENGNEFSWSKNLEKYAKGDREGALIGLGHILHLAEDMTVPDHTRNDAHMGYFGTGESLYEKWADGKEDRQTLVGWAKKYFNEGLRIKSFSSALDIFNFLAKYSNENYVSPDSIASINNNIDFQYSKPFITNSDGYYVYSNDYLYNDSHKVYINLTLKTGDVIDTLVNFDKKDYSVLEDYFPRLAKQAILSGAGLVDLFLTQAEKARADYLEAERKKAEERARREAERQAALTQGSWLSRFWNQVAYSVSGAASAVANSISSTYSSASSFLSSTGNTVANAASSIGYLTTYAASSIKQAAGETAQTVSTSITNEVQKTVLFVQKQITSPGVDLTAAILANPISNPQTVSSPSNNQIIVTNNNPAETNQLVASNQQRNYGEVGSMTSYSGGGSSYIPTGNSSGHNPNDNSAPVEYVKAPSPNILSVIDNSKTFPTTVVSVSGTGTAGYIISNNYSSGTTTVDSSGYWSLLLSGISQGTSTIQFFAEPDFGMATTSYFNASTSATTTIIYTKSAASEIAFYIDNVGPEITVPDPSQCSLSFSADGCVISTTTVTFLWTSDSPDIAYYTLNVKDGITATTTDHGLEIVFSPSAEYEVDISATDINGNVGPVITKKVAIYDSPVVINEVAWMGTAASANDEWIELYNPTDYKINLANWTLAASSWKAGKQVALSGEISPKGYYLLERTDDGAVSNVTADLVYTGALNNTNEVLYLKFASTTLDQTALNDDDSWPAGDNTTKATMERKNPLTTGNNTTNWFTNNQTVFNGKDKNGNWFYGTPRAKNSFSYLLNGGEDIVNDLVLTKENGPYIINGDLSIYSGASLTIGPGTIIRFSAGELFVFGKLFINGSAEDKVSMIPLSDHSFGEDLNPIDVSPYVSGRYYWYGNKGGIYAENGELTIKDLIFKNAEKGIKIENSQMEIDGLDYSNYREGVEIYGTSTAKLANMRFDAGNSDSLDIYNGSRVVADNIQTKNNQVSGGIEVYNNSSLILTGFVAEDIDSAALEIHNNSSLTVDDSEIKSIRDDGIDVYNNSKLEANNLTVKDISDYGGGLTLFNDSQAKLKNVEIQNVSNDVLDIFNRSTADIENSRFVGTDESSSGSWFFGDRGCGVSSYKYPINIQNSEFANGYNGIMTDGCIELNLSNVKIKDFSNYSLYVDAGSEINGDRLDISDNYIGAVAYDDNDIKIKINNSNIANNTIGVSVDFPDESLVLDFKKNWWGEASGPYNEFSNPDGLGNSVADTVDFSEWLTTPAF
ncbi:MAG: right-handed parallel beta-helix repeat-containing protein [bacterium]